MKEKKTSISIKKIKLTDLNRKKMLLMGLVSLFTIAIISTGTYAIWNSEMLTGDNTIKSGQIKMSYTEINEITMENALPMKDEEGKLLTNYFDFQVLTYIKTRESDGTKRKINYNIVLEPLTVETPLEDNEIKVYLTMVENGKETEVVAPTTIDQLTDYLLNNHEDIFSNNKGEVITNYRLRAWVDEKVDPIKFNEKKYSYKFRVNVNSDNIVSNSAPLDQSGANKPELTSNMIPVYYDEKNDVWRKADSNNEDKSNKWYSYSEKRWANAVTIDDTIVKEKISKNKTVSLTNGLISTKTYSSFTSGGKGIANANSSIRIIVNISNDGTFGFTATVSSDYYDKLDVKVTKNTGSAYNVISDGNQVTKKYSDKAVASDIYIIDAKYKKDANTDKYHDNGVLDQFIYPEGTDVIYFNSKDSGGAEGQDWTASDENTGTKNAVVISDNITYNKDTEKYELVDSVDTKISSNIAGKYICPNVIDSSCKSVYKITEVSSNITKVDEYSSTLLPNGRSSLLNASPGTEIKMEDINSMWVWIPRYTYTYFDAKSPEEIKIKFENGTESTGTIKCKDYIRSSGSSSETCTDSKNGSLKSGISTYTHPAFTFGNQELTGIWVGKFENSATEILTSSNRDNSTVIIKPNVTSLRYKALSYLFRDVRQMEQSNNIYGFSQNDNTEFNWTGELTNDNNNIDTHMMKNMEWGAVAYLSHSKFGANERISNNSSTVNVTGCGPKHWTSAKGEEICEGYNTTLGQSASTTKNVYGVYDMYAGTNEYVMGVIVNSSNQVYISNAENWNNSLLPLDKYYDKYTYNASSSTDSSVLKLGKLGDATKETSNWYGDAHNFPWSGFSWFRRGGGSSGEGGNSGLFHFSSLNGPASTISATRSVLSINNNQ